MLRRMDQGASWTVHLKGRLTIKSSSPAPVEEFDGAALREDLLALVDRGVLLIEAVDAAVETIVTYKTRKAGINALRKLGGLAGEVVDRHARPAQKDRYVSLIQHVSAR